MSDGLWSHIERFQAHFDRSVGGMMGDLCAMLINLLPTGMQRKTYISVVVDVKINTTSKSCLCSR